MALVKQDLKSKFKSLFKKLVVSMDQEDAIDLFASEAAEIVDSYIKSADVVGTTSDGATITTAKLK